jgi:hypothetical protein
MQVEWKTDDLGKGLGHGVEVYLKLDEGIRKTLGFIEGYSWLHDKDPQVTVVLDETLKELPKTLITEIRLSILLFLTDKDCQNGDAIIHGFGYRFNA